MKILKNDLYLSRRLLTEKYKYEKGNCYNEHVA
jgi:hypothetical protein